MWEAWNNVVTLHTFFKKIHRLLYLFVNTSVSKTLLQGIEKGKPTAIVASLGSSSLSSEIRMYKYNHDPEFKL